MTHEIYDPNIPAQTKDMEIVVDTTSGIGDKEDRVWTIGNKAPMKVTMDSEKGNKLQTLIGIINGAKIDIEPNSKKISRQYLHDLISMVLLIFFATVSGLYMVICTVA